jgi:hypothetical protein
VAATLSLTTLGDRRVWRIAHAVMRLCVDGHTLAARRRDDTSAESADDRHMATDCVDLHHTADLLVDVRDGRADSFESLIRICRPIVERYARMYAWADRDVDDIVQEVWI